MHKETHATKPEYGYSSKGKCFLIGNNQQIICIKSKPDPIRMKRQSSVISQCSCLWFSVDRPKRKQTKGKKIPVTSFQLPVNSGKYRGKKHLLTEMPLTPCHLWLILWGGTWL